MYYNKIANEMHNTDLCKQNISHCHRSAKKESNSNVRFISHSAIFQLYTVYLIQ